NTQSRLNDALSELEQVKRLLEDSRRQEQKQKEQVERLMYEEKHWKQALEEEKARTEAAVRNTLSERKAIDKSLAAMEKENSELYRNCAQLQSQIAQLERDAGSRNVTKMLKDQSELEARISKLIVEKRQ
ncbi:hypothetical protein TELCIR_21018, partial [Teladorsagia circumcincta]